MHVFYGSADSLTPIGAQSIIGAKGGSRFGAPLAAGDFNGDGVSDLVGGGPLHSLGAFLFTTDAVGYVEIFPGGPTGLQLDQNQFLFQNAEGVADAAESDDLFGFALATGDFNGDLRDDLAVGVPGEDLLSNTVNGAGAVHVFFGRQGPGGDLVDAANDMFFGQGSLAGVAIEAGDAMGRALAAGKFNNDAFEDLAIGAPGEDIGSISNAGLVTVVYGGTDGPNLTNIQHWHQDVTGIPDTAEEGDEFGRALSAWNFGRNERRCFPITPPNFCVDVPVTDLAIGVPFEDLLSVITGTQQVDAGAIVVIYGTAAGLSATGSEFWHQDRGGIASAASAGDRFGVTLY